MNIMLYNMSTCFINNIIIKYQIDQMSLKHQINKIIK